jgi:hypothetical protein
MQLVDKGDHFSTCIAYFLQYGFQALFELATVLGASHHGTEVQRNHTLAPQAFRHISLDYPARKALDDGCLADAWLAYEDRVVLRTP